MDIYDKIDKCVALLKGAKIIDAIFIKDASNSDGGNSQMLELQLGNGTIIIINSWDYESHISGLYLDEKKEGLDSTSL